MMTKIWRAVVTVLVILLLVLNIYLLTVLSNARNGLENSITTIRNALALLSQESYVISVKVDHNIPINTTIPFSQTVTIPVNIDYPLSTVVNTSFNIPLLGKQRVSLPIDTIVPIHLNYDIPIQETIQISAVYPLKMELPVTVDIPIEVISQVDGYLREIEINLK